MRHLLWSMGLLANGTAAVILVLAVYDAQRIRIEEMLIVCAVMLYILLNAYFVVLARPSDSHADNTLLGLWIQTKKAKLRRELEQKESS